MFDLVPLAGAWREVTDAYAQPSRVGEALQLHAPQSRAGRVAPAAVGGDQQIGGIGVGFLAHLTPPAFEGRDRKLRGVVVDADADPSLVARGVVDAVRNDFAQLLVDEVVHAHGLRLALALPLASGVF